MCNVYLSYTLHVHVCSCASATFITNWNSVVCLLSSVCVVEHICCHSFCLIGWLAIVRDERAGRAGHLKWEIPSTLTLLFQIVLLIQLLWQILMRAWTINIRVVFCPATLPCNMLSRPRFRGVNYERYHSSTTIPTQAPEEQLRHLLHKNNHPNYPRSLL